MRSSRFLVHLLVLIAGIAGCQPLPQPFQPSASRKEANPLVHLQDGSGIFVRRVAGMTDSAADALAQDMAEALRARNLPAFTESGNQGSYILSGEATALDRGDGLTLIRLVWKLADPDGTPAGEHVVDAAIPRPAWAAGNADQIRTLASRSAGAVAALIQEPAPVDRTTTLPQRTLYVWPIDGAPDAAGGLLRAELEAALRNRNLRVASGLASEAVVVTGVVSMKPAEHGNRQLSLEWTVIRPDGGELGKLNQTNTIASDSLEKNWPNIARAIAAAAADGIRNLFDKLPERALN